MQYNTSNKTVKVWVWVLRHTTHLPHINFFLMVCLVRALKITPSLNHAGCVITTSGVFSFFSFSYVYLLSLLFNV
jgi:hypothetical protein